MNLKPFGRASILVLVGLAGACSSSDAEEPAPSPGGGGVDSLVPPGKADDYFSDKAQEYTLTGTTAGTVDADCLAANADADDPERQCKLQSVGLKNFAIGWFVNQYVIDKHDSANEDWGGFTGMTRPAGYSALETGTPDADGKFSYKFTGEMSGPLDMLDKLPTEECADEPGARCFTLELPALTNETLAQMDTGSEWYRKSPFNEYDPAKYTGEKESLVLKIEAYPRSNDAYLEYNKLFDATQMAHADGKLKIGMFVGWDYYDDRYDLQTAKELYRYLTSTMGFKSPVDSYDDLKIDSGEFTKTIQVQGEDVEVSVLLVHPGQGDPGDPVFAGAMKSALVQAFTERQVITFEGHAGPLYGFALGNWRKTEAGELDDTELPGLNIPADFYQVVMISGCDTYMVADSLYANQVKTGRKDLDVITTTSFSNAAGRGRTTKALVDAVINQDGDDGDLAAKQYGEILRDLNNEWYMTPLYGVHGIDDNPRDNPLANKSVLCAECAGHDECGGDGNLCVNLSAGASTGHCTTKCQTDEDCPGGYACYDIASGNTIVSRNCVPSTLRCE